MKEVMQSTLAEMMVEAVIGGDGFPNVMRTHTETERWTFASMSEWKDDL